MRLNSLCTVLLLLFAGLAAVAVLPTLAGAVGAPSDNYTIPDIPTENTTSDEIKPPVNFLLEGPSSQGKSALPGVIAAFTSVPAHDNNDITVDDRWYLDIDINAPGWLYIYEYYPNESNPTGKWIAYKWHIKESGAWKLGPFSAQSGENEGQHSYRIWFYSSGQWAAENPKSPQNNVISWTYHRTAPGLIITNFEINPPGINAGDGTLLFWDVQGASSIEISGLGTMSGPGGTLIIKPSVTTTYILTARDAGGKTLSQSATVTVRPVPFAEQAMKVLGNPVILVMLLAAGVIIVLAFLLMRRRYAGQSEIKDIPSLPVPLLPEKKEEFHPLAAARAILEVPNGPGIRIAGDSTTVGRADLARSLEIDKLSLISRQHFRITFREEQYFIEDLGSAGGTSVNSADIRVSGAVSLEDDDLIEPSGAVKLRFHILS